MVCVAEASSRVTRRSRVDPHGRQAQRDEHRHHGHRGGQPHGHRSDAISRTDRRRRGTAWWTTRTSRSRSNPTTIVFGVDDIASVTASSFPAASDSSPGRAMGISRKLPRASRPRTSCLHSTPTRDAVSRTASAGHRHAGASHRSRTRTRGRARPRTTVMTLAAMAATASPTTASWALIVLVSTHQTSIEATHHRSQARATRRSRPALRALDMLGSFSTRGALVQPLPDARSRFMRRSGG